MPLEVAKQKTGGSSSAAYKLAQSRQEMFDEARDSLEKAARRIKKYVDRDRNMGKKKKKSREKKKELFTTFDSFYNSILCH